MSFAEDAVKEVAEMRGPCAFIGPHEPEGEVLFGCLTEMPAEESC